MNTTVAPSEVQQNMAALAENTYPGRFIAMGVSEAGNLALQAYAIMGRSEGSRDRIFVDDGLGIRTVAPGKTAEEMATVPMANLIYYRAMQDRGHVHVVTNGAQTEPIQWDMLKHGDLWLAIDEAPVVDDVDLASYEPDEPNYTPRIAGTLDFRPNGVYRQAQWGVVTRQGLEPFADPTARISRYETDFSGLTPGVGFAVQTYMGNGDPLPSFDREPYTVSFGEDALQTAEMLWAVLNKDNRVAVVVKEISLASGETEGYHIINRHEQ